MRQSRPNGWRQGSPSASLTLTADLEVLHTTATDQLPAFSAGLRNVLGSIGGSGSSSVIER
jgi:hypothetical protein